MNHKSPTCFSRTFSVLKSNCGLTVASFIERNWIIILKNKSKFQFFFKLMPCPNYCKIMVLPQLVAAKIEHSLWSHQALQLFQSPKKSKSKSNLPNSNVLQKIKTQTLVQPGTRFCKNLIRSLIFSLLTCLFQPNHSFLSNQSNCIGF